jgi:hypothetical protein
MTPTAQTDADFSFRPLPEIQTTDQYPPPRPVPPTPPTPLGPSSLGPLAALAGPWTGRGFNTIWRPHFPPPQDRFLELNLTSENLVFTPIKGPIPNRGFLQPDLTMMGLTYMQQIADATNQAGLHIEPGIWALVPPTTDPEEPESVVRMASIPHGTTILAQGEANTFSGPPTIPDNNIIPFPPNGPSPANSDFSAASAVFTELDLGVATEFRLLDPGVDQAMVENPNSLIQSAIAGQQIASTTALTVSTTPAPVPGGGTANTAFLHAGNADATVMNATFWIETVTDPSGGPSHQQLQYSQTVMLVFNGLNWPHVTVATLVRP